MPGRGQPWKTGGHIDSTIEKADLTSTVLGQLGNWIATKHYSSSSTENIHLPPSLLADSAGTENADRQAVMPQAGRVKSIHANVRTASATQNSNAVVQVVKNGTNEGSALSFSTLATGVTSQLTPNAIWSANDLLEVKVSFDVATGTVEVIITVEYDLT
jgi:hypothetical protein